MMMLLWNGGELKFHNIDSWGQCYKYFYRGILPPLHGFTVILCYKAILPWKLPWNFNPRKSRVKIIAVIYSGIVL